MPVPDDEAKPVAPAAPPRPAALPAWGDKVLAFEKRWVAFEVKLAVGVLVCEMLALCFWVFLKGLSSPPGASSAGVVFRAAISATVLGAVAWALTKKQPERTRSVITTVAVVGGLFLGRAWANVGVHYTAEIVNWYQDASTLTLIGGLARVGTRFTIWLAMLGASLATSSGKHINVDVVMRFLSPRVRVPAAIAAWLAAAVVCFGATWGFVDHIAITSFGATPNDSAGAKIGHVFHDGREHLFATRRQIGIDTTVGFRVLAGRKYTEALTGDEWNEKIKSGGYESWFTDEQIKALYVPPNTPYVAPLVVIPGKTQRGLLVEDLNLLFPFGFFMIGLKFLLRALLAFSGHVVVDPDAAHREDDDDGEPHPHEGGAEGGA